MPSAALPLVLRGYGAGGNDVTAAGVLFFCRFVTDPHGSREFATVKVYAPASSANMSVGFGRVKAQPSHPLTASLLGDVVSVGRKRTISVCITLRAICRCKPPPEPRENIVYQCWERFAVHWGKPSRWR